MHHFPLIREEAQEDKKRFCINTVVNPVAGPRYYTARQIDYDADLILI